MTSWREAFRWGTISGTVASLTSSVVLSLRGKRENGSPHAPHNAISHWVWGDKAIRRDGPSMRYTALGYGIHHASSTLWGVLYEKWFGDKARRGDIATAVGGGALVAGLACFVDYQLTPPRLRPGFEQRLSTPALVLVYASFGAGLVLRGMTQAPLPRIGATQTLPRVPAPRIGVRSYSTR